MDIIEAITGRRSCRAFLAKPVPKEMVAELLQLAVNAPSANNLQPWELTVVAGAERERLSRALLKAYREKHISCGSGAVKPLPEAVRRRGKQAGAEMQPFLDKLGVTAGDFINEGSCRFYNAPLAVVICLDDAFSPRQYIDAGTFVAYLALAAHGRGLASCPIALIADYADVIREELNIPENQRVVIAVALGYPDTASPMAAFRSSRADIKDLARWR